MSRDEFAELQHTLQTLARNGTKLDGDSLAEVARRIGKQFGVRKDEVAILAVTRGGQFLSFLLPAELAPVGNIPVNSGGALAARTAREKRAELANNFAQARHASVFESVPLGETRGEPIQKIMSAPIVLEKNAVGVIQISRKGQNQATAGPDFTPGELAELIQIARLLAPCLPCLEVTRK